MTGPVPRETSAPQPPVEAAALFGATLPTAHAYAALLAGAGVQRGLVGPREVPRLWPRHLLNCAALADGLPRGVDLADLGSGAGLPGLVLAIRRPDLRVTLVEPSQRRVSFLHECVDRLGLPNVELLRARAEQLHGQRRFTVVTARAVAPLDRLLGWALPLVGPGGWLLAIKGASAAAELAAAEPELTRLGAGPVALVRFGQGTLDPPTTAVRVASGDRAGLGWQRTRGRPAGPSPRGSSAPSHPSHPSHPSPARGKDRP